MNIPIWPGSSSFLPGGTPFGYYDYDAHFQTDADKVARWCATRLGYPIMAVELQDIHFYTALEEAITEFSTQVNMYNAKDYMYTLIGSSTETNLTGQVITPNLGRTIQIAKQYGTEAGSGGTVDWKRGYVNLIPGQTQYDLNALWASRFEPGKNIEVKRVYHDFSPAIVRYFDPYVGTGAGTQQMLDSFGWGSYSPAVSFLVMPLYADLLRIQAIEMNDMIRKSSYSFELHNNKLRVFPIPTMPVQMWFEYIVVEDRNNALLSTGSNSISDLGNIPFNRMVYTNVSDIGKQWIYKYALAISKEIQGLIRGKYSTVPIPGAEVTLNGSDLISQGREDKAALVTELQTLLDTLTRKGQAESETIIDDALQSKLKKVPLYIYIK
jgi:hypothetical protein